MYWRVSIKCEVSLASEVKRWIEESEEQRVTCRCFDTAARVTERLSGLKIHLEVKKPGVSTKKQLVKQRLKVVLAVHIKLAANYTI